MLSLIRTYHLFWLYSLSLLLGMTVVTSVYGRGACACLPALLPAIAETTAVNSCCQLPGMPKATHRTTTSCEQQPTATDAQLQSCCCDTHPRWFALQQDPPPPLSKAMGITTLFAGLPPTTIAQTPPIAAAPDWITALPPSLAYQPPLLYKDLPVFVQSFLL